MKIHHFGIACQDVEEAVAEFKKFHNVVWQSQIVTDNLQDARLCMVKTDLGVDYEFISGNQVDRMVKKGISYYHAGYEVDSLEDKIEDLLAKGAMMISEPKPAILFNNRRVAFLYLPYGLIELVER